MNIAGLADLRSWLNPRNARGWLLLLVILYALAGFFLLPWVVKTQLPEQSQAMLKRTATVDEVSFNPFSLRLRAYGFRLDDDRGEPLAEAEQLHANLQVRSLFKLALVFGDLELVQPRVYLTRYAFADTNIGRLVEEQQSAEAAPTDDTSGGLLRAVVDSLVIENGMLIADDRMLEERFVTELGPINIALSNFSTLPDDSGEQQVSIKAETGAHLEWSGNLSVNPLQSYGRLTVSGSPLPVIHRYLRDQLGFDLDNCCLDIALDYSVNATPDGAIKASISDLGVSLRNVILTADDGSGEVLTLPELTIENAGLRWPEAEIEVGALTVNDPELGTWLSADGTLNLTQLLGAPDAAADAGDDSTVTVDQPADDEPAASWKVRLNRLNINNMQVNFTDYSLADPEPLQLQNIDIAMSDLSNMPDNRSPLAITAAVASGGTLNIAGDLAVLPSPDVSLDFTIDDIALSALQPWVDNVAYMAIDSGALSLNGALRSTADDTLAVRADIAVSTLQVSDTQLSEPLVGWQQLEFKGIDLSLGNRTVEVSRIALNQPFAKLLIDQQAGTNFGALVKPAEGDAPQPDTSTETEPFIVRIGSTTIENGKLDFTDLSLPLPFRAPISEFGGDISAFASNSQQPSKLELSGKVGDFGLSTINGELNLLDPTSKADITALFRNVSMPEVSPYSVEFVGQKIATGKLDLDLKYQFDDRLIRGENKMVLRQFELGDKVDNPDAMDLPLGLALGLLRDVNGVINLNLNVSGDLDEPSFSARGLILKAFANVITKAVAAPFKLLGALVPGLDAEDSNQIVFAPGSAELTPPEREKLVLVAAALEQRPGLLVDVPTGFSTELDTAGLQKQAAESLLEAELDAGDSSDEKLLRKQRKALEKLVRSNNALGDA